MPFTMTQVEKHKLLRDNLPELVYPRGHRSRFTGVEALVQHPAAELLTAYGNVTIARASGGEGARLSLRFLRPSRYPTGTPVNRGDRIRLLTLHGWEDSLPDPFEHVAYGRAVEDIVDGRSRTFLQYWLFAPVVAGQFGHEGDINLIEMMMTPGLQAPEYVLITQHRGAEVRHIGQVQKTDDGHVRIFVSNRNALLFAPGAQWTRAGWWRDNCHVPGDEPGIWPELRLLEGAEWALWPGRLGNQRAFCARTEWDHPVKAFRLEGKRGPFAWVDPLRFLAFRKEMKRRDVRARDRLRPGRSNP
jgi:hypothetical protein